jgi:hypothetical protein
MLLLVLYFLKFAVAVISKETKWWSWEATKGRVTLLVLYFQSVCIIDDIHIL